MNESKLVPFSDLRMRMQSMREGHRRTLGKEKEKKVLEAQEVK